MDRESTTTKNPGADSTSPLEHEVAEIGAAELAALPRKSDVWAWVAHYERFEDRVASAFDPAARRLFGLAAFLAVWTYWMPDFAMMEEYLGALVVVPIFFYYGIGVGGLSWGLWCLLRERFPWDE